MSCALDTQAVLFGTSVLSGLGSVIGTIGGLEDEGVWGKEEGPIVDADVYDWGDSGD